MQVYSTTPAFDPDWFARADSVLPGAATANLWVRNNITLILAICDGSTVVQLDLGPCDWEAVAANPREFFLAALDRTRYRQQRLDLRGSPAELAAKTWTT